MKLQLASDLSDDYEYAFVFSGQSNARPWGSRAEGMAAAPHLNQGYPGVDLAQVLVRVGSGVEMLTVRTSIATDKWVGAEVRLGTLTVPVAGYGTIVHTGVSREFTADAGTDTFTATGHGMANAWVVSVSSSGAGAALPSGLVAGRAYYVVGASTDTFQLSETLGGAAINIADAGTGTHTVVTLRSNTTTSLPFTADASDVCLTATAHGFANGQQVAVSSTGLLPGGLSAATVYFVRDADVLTFKLAATIGGGAVDITDSGSGTHTITRTMITVQWTKTAPASSTPVASGYIVQRDMRWAFYEHVRVLTPYQPEQSGSYPAGAVLAPGYTVPSSITSYADLALWLPLTFQEGLYGYGISNTAGGGAATAAAATTFNFTTSVTAGVLAGGYVRVVHDGGISWSDIGDNSTTQLTGLAWQGAGTPSGTPSTWDWEAWLPHWANHPHHFLPGVGFRYPNNDMQPAANAPSIGPWTGRLFNRARGQTVFAYGDRFGTMVEFAWRMSVALGKRVHIILLGINSSGLITQSGLNLFGFPGVLGWWDPQKYLDWSPANPDGNAARLQRMIQVMAPAALAAEGNTKPLRILGAVTFQGEADAISEVGRELYSRTLNTFYSWLRRVCAAVGTPYGASAKLPVVHASLPTVPWELSGEFYGVQLTGDEDGLVNAAIRAFAAQDGFAATIDTNDSPKLADPLHFNGTGEQRNAELAADAMAQLIEQALAYGVDEAQVQAAEVDVCNQALGNVGDGGVVTAIDPPDGSTEAAQCARFYPLARDGLLEAREWAFATRRVPLVALAESPVDAWDFAYGVPGDCLKVRGVYLPDDPTETPQDYVLEATVDGLVIYTDAEDAMVRYVVRVVDPRRWPATFRTALGWQLAGMLAGALLRGKAAVLAQRHCAEKLAVSLSAAGVHDAGQRRAPLRNVPSWLSGR